MAKHSGSNAKVEIGAATVITAASHNAGTVTVTAAGHGLSVGRSILMAGVVGMTDLNTYFVVDAINGNDFDVTLTTAQTYTSDGTVQQRIEVTNISFTESEAILEDTDSSNAGWKTHTAKGISKLSGTLTGFFDSGLVPETLVGESLSSVKIYTETGYYWSGTLLVGQVEQAVDVPGESLVQITYAFEGTGEWTETTP